MKDRTAVDTIRGYFYQFDYYILRILKLENELDKVTIEGIEDVDVTIADEITAVQCKYYSKREYNHSTIKEPIMLMLSDFSQNIGRSLKYNIYGHFKGGHDKLPQSISIDFLKKNFLTYKSKGITYEKHKELELSDDNLKQFLNLLSIDIHAPEYQEQNSAIFQEIRKQLSCSEIDAEFFYNNALSLVSKLAVQQEVVSRTISKKEFLVRINSREQLFDNWYLIFKGKDAFFRIVKRKYFSHMNMSPYSRFILIDCSNDIDEVQIKEGLLHIAYKLSKVSKRESNPFCPYVYLHGINENKLVKVKQLLRDDSLIFVDGHNFKGADFSLSDILVNPSYYNQLKLKIINEMKGIDLILNRLANTRKIYQFYIDRPFYTNKDHQHYQIPITMINDIEKII